ncbi:MAG: hypothetical protein GY806_21205 [Gammaproteobacteria bacterium]|nr:hypothetical protein [Gammaproteobacteria bacterium]
MGKDNDISAKSFAIDSDGDSRLLTDIETGNGAVFVDSRQVIPSTKAIYSLFSENSLFLTQD